MPANEHVTMQIASQIFKIKTAACGMIFFDDGSPAYITRRFDYKPDGTKYQLEDFAILMGKSPEKEGDDFKYNASYADIAKLIVEYVPAAITELTKFFQLVIFNYLFGNGDAHLKNFALMESDQGDYFLAPAYDLMCTALHIDDGNLALRDGLYEGDMDEPSYRDSGIYTRQSFMVFAEKTGVQAAIAKAIIDQSIQNAQNAKEMIDRSFLSEPSKNDYKKIIEERIRRF